MMEVVHMHRNKYRHLCSKTIDFVILEHIVYTHTHLNKTLSRVELPLTTWKGGCVSLTISFKLCIECCDAGVCCILHTFIVYTPTNTYFIEYYRLPNSKLVHIIFYWRCCSKCGITFQISAFSCSSRNKFRRWYWKTCQDQR